MGTAAVCTAFGAPLEIEELDLRAPGAGEIEVRIEAVAICHSDISFADGAWGGELPLLLGHEAAGRVTALGDGVTGLEVGARMTVLALEGGLLVHSPVAVDPETVAHLGTPRWVVSPNKLHHLHIGPWIEGGLEGWAAPGLPEKRPDLAFSGGSQVQFTKESMESINGVGALLRW